jgi:hypothetical protein
MVAWMPLAQALSTQHALQAFDSAVTSAKVHHHGHTHDAHTHSTTAEDNGTSPISVDHDHDLPSLLQMIDRSLPEIYHPQVFVSACAILLAPLQPFERPPRS